MPELFTDQKISLPGVEEQSNEDKRAHKLITEKNVFWIVKKVQQSIVRSKTLPRMAG